MMTMILITLIIIALALQNKIPKRNKILIVIIIIIVINRRSGVNSIIHYMEEFRQLEQALNSY